MTIVIAMYVDYFCTIYKTLTKYQMHKMVNCRKNENPKW